MFTYKDIETRSVFILNCIDHRRSLRVSAGELILQEKVDEKDVTLTKFPFQKILAIFVIGHMTLTTPLIEKCKQFGVALVVMKPNLRPIFFWSNSAEANYLLRKNQYSLDENDLTIPKIIIQNKIYNQKALLIKTRKKDWMTLEAIDTCQAAYDTIPDTANHNSLMGIEGIAAKAFFSAYYQSYDWQGRHPRIKSDQLNVTLDIGYTILFNFIEMFLRLYGFDVYIGVYHRLWFKRKSLVCDIMEPFRCIIDHATLLAYNRKQFKKNDFTCIKHEYRLKTDKSKDYYKVYYDELIEHKKEIFLYIQQYYRCFMGRKSVSSYPNYILK